MRKAPRVRLCDYAAEPGGPPDTCVCFGAGSRSRRRHSPPNPTRPRPPAHHSQGTTTSPGVGLGSRHRLRLLAHRHQPECHPQPKSRRGRMAPDGAPKTSRIVSGCQTAPRLRTWPSRQPGGQHRVDCWGVALLGRQPSAWLQGTGRLDDGDRPRPSTTWAPLRPPTPDRPAGLVRHGPASSPCELPQGRQYWPSSEPACAGTILEPGPPGSPQAPTQPTETSEPGAPGPYRPKHHPALDTGRTAASPCPRLTRGNSGSEPTDAAPDREVPGGRRPTRK